MLFTFVTREDSTMAYIFAICSYFYVNKTKLDLHK